jgi:hypothetical protein
MFKNRVRQIIEDLKVDLGNSEITTIPANLAPTAATVTRVYYGVRRLLNLFIGERAGTGYSSRRRRLSFSAIEEQITATTGGTSYTLTQQIPPNSIIFATMLNFDTAITLTGDVTNIGVGLSTAGSGHYGDCVLSGLVMVKNTPSAGITPVVAPAIAVIATGLSRASGVTTVTATNTVAVGDTVRLTGANDNTFVGDFVVLATPAPTSAAFAVAQVGQPDATPTVKGYFAPWIKLVMRACNASATSGTTGTFNALLQKIRVQAIYIHVSDLQPAV